MARNYALIKRQLLLARDWTADLVLDESGEVWVLDTETGGPPQLATPTERRSALLRGLHAYPEILPLLPERPAAAKTCELCDGAGVPAIAFENPQLSNLLCKCAGAGWTHNE